MSWLCLYQREKQGNHSISGFQVETHTHQTELTDASKMYGLSEGL